MEMLTKEKLAELLKSREMKRETLEIDGLGAVTIRELDGLQLMELNDAAALGVNTAEIPLEKCRLVSSTRPVRLKNRRIKRADEYTPEERRKRAEAILSGLATVSSLTEYIED